MSAIIPWHDDVMASNDDSFDATGAWTPEEIEAPDAWHIGNFDDLLPEYVA